MNGRGCTTSSFILDSMNEYILSITDASFKIGISSNLADTTLNPLGESKQ